MPKGIWNKPRPTVAERFAAKWIPEPNSGCWLWTAFCDQDGYGKLQIDRQAVAAPRVSLFLANGVWPVKALHSCDNPPCVNPDHLRAGSAQDNTNDMMKRNRHPLKSRTHCRRGHEYTPENTWICKNGWRRCRTCDAAREKLRDRKRNK